MFAYVLLIALVAASAHGGPCGELSGVWRNALGSNMSVSVLNDGKFTGHYSTAVESKPGAAAFSSPIAGVVRAVEGGSVVSWNVLWSGGKSLTTWVGQCISCDGREVIYTTWALRSLKKPLDKWMTTLVNQDTFWRLDGAEPPSLPETESLGVNSAVLGRWTSPSGDVINITFAAQKGKLEGDHLTPEKGGSAEPVPLFGATDGRHNYTAFGFSAVGPTAVRGWTGHIYNPQESPSPVLETSWITHAFSDDCSDPRRFVSFGMDNYTQPLPPVSSLDG